MTSVIANVWKKTTISLTDSPKASLLVSVEFSLTDVPFSLVLSAIANENDDITQYIVGLIIPIFKSASKCTHTPYISALS